MIKGVNRRIVEITNTDNEYFEKIVLYIKADKANVSENWLALEARAYIGERFPDKKREPKRVIFALKIMLAAVSATLAALLAYLILY